MKITGILRDPVTHFSINTEAKPIILPSGQGFQFSLKGLPIRWSREYARRLLTSWGRKFGFTGVNIIKTSEKGLFWTGKVLFCKPVPVNRSLIEFTCPECGASHGNPCKGVPKGAYHGKRGNP